MTTVGCAQALDVEAAVGSLDGLGEGSLAVLQGNLGERTTGALFDAALARGLSVVLNPSPVAGWQTALLGRCAAVFANEYEAKTLTGLRPADAAADIVRRGAGRAVVTMGSAGLWLASPAGRERMAAVTGPVLDTAGAGDTLQSAALAVAGGTAVDRTAVEIARRAAALTIAREGTSGAFPTSGELRRLMLEGRNSL